MYPTLSHLIQDLFGFYIPLPIQTYGFFVALAFIAAGFVLISEFKRMESESLMPVIQKDIMVGEPASALQLIGSGFFGFILGYKILPMITDYSVFVDNPQHFILSGGGSWLGALIGMAVSVYATYYDKHKQKLDKPYKQKVEQRPYHLVGNILFVAAVSGIIGAKLFHILENLDDFFASPADAVLSFSGLSFYGGLVLGTISVILYARMNSINVPPLADAAAPTLAIAYAVGRMGCQMSGDGCWGIDNPDPMPQWLTFLPEWVWSYTYPNNVINAGAIIEGCAGKFCHELAVPVFPTPLYETTLMSLVFGILWFLRKRLNVTGQLFAVYLVLSGLERFFIEKIRINNVYHIFGAEITQAEIISTLSVLGGIGLFIYLQMKHSSKIEKI